MDYEVIIGLEVHAQLLTRSKMFCSCRADYQDAPPNTFVCPVCLGAPGVLPVINKKAVEYTIMTALALNCEISPYTKFDRKNYSYPDLMKGYQISQYELPISKNGWLEIEAGGRKRRIGIRRVHLEEDVAKLFHIKDPSGEAYSLVDVNRSGVPLMEIVTEPDIRSPEEARLFLVKLRDILRYLGVSSGDMEKGSFRCDANISIRMGERSGEKVELKNMNSFKAVERALEYEVRRQVELLKEGRYIPQETRGWDEERGITVSQRTKEYAHDYRYFPEPDLPPLVIEKEWVEEIRKKIPELPDARRERFEREYGLPSYDAGILTSSKAFADFFEKTLSLYGSDAPLEKRAKNVSNWMLGEVLRLLNKEGKDIDEVELKPEHLSELLTLIDRGVLSIPMGKEVLEEVFHKGTSPSEIVEKRGISQISSEEDIERVVVQVIRDNEKAVNDYRSGKEQALKFLLGQVMKATKGRANPQLALKILKEKLG